MVGNNRIPLPGWVLNRHNNPGVGGAGNDGRLASCQKSLIFCPWPASSTRIVWRAIINSSLWDDPGGDRTRAFVMVGPPY